MEPALIIAIVCAVLASPVLVKLIELFTDKKKKQLDKILSELEQLKTTVDDIKIDHIRTNIMVLISNYPDSSDIPVIAEAYVDKYNGDSYIIPLVVDWYDKKHLEYPEWLKKAHEQHCNYKLTK